MKQSAVLVYLDRLLLCLDQIGAVIGLVMSEERV